MRTNISAYKDGELEENLRDQFWNHLQSCDACREELKELDKIDLLVKGLPEISVSDTFITEIIAGTHAVNSPRHLKLSLPQRIVDRLLLLLESIFELLPGYKSQGTGSLDEFGDFPPLSLSHAYFNLIGQ
jgi:hypothetical protein